MTWERALEADARLAAKNAVLIRAALRQSFDAERAFIGYQNTQPDDTLTLAQQRVRSRSWAIMNIRPNLEPLRQVLYKLWAEAYVLGDLAAREAIAEMERLQKADVGGMVDWSKWKPGDAASAVLLKPPKAFQKLLENAGITLKGFSDTTLTDIGNAIGEAIELGLDAKRSAKNIMRHVANPARALSIAITEQNRAISTATQNRYLEAGLRENRWLVFNPCGTCAKNEGQIVPIGTPFPSGDTQPPAHPHCRCALASVPFDQRNPANTAGSVTEPEPTVEEVTQEPATDYRMRHQAPTRADEFGSPATDIGTEMMPGFYDNPRNFTSGISAADKESTAVLMSIRNKPDELVTIYRAVPEGVTQINPGDWVTLSPSYAEQHLASNIANGRVISMQIPAKDLWFDGNSINEFGYDPISKPVKANLSFVETESFTRAKTGMKLQIDDFLQGPRSYEGDVEKMGEVITAQGWNKPSLIINTDDYEKLKATGKYVEVFRGGPKGLAEGFVSGKPWIGDGNAGPGTYVTIDKSRAEAFAGLAKTSTGGSEVVTALVPKEMLDQAPNIENSPAHSLPSKWSGKKRADYVANAANGIPAYEPSYESSAPGDYVIYNTSAIVIKGEQ